MNKVRANDFTHDEGLLMVGLSNQAVPILHALCKKTGHDMAVVIAVAIQKLAADLLDENEKKNLAKEIADATTPSTY